MKRKAQKNFCLFFRINLTSHPIYYFAFQYAKRGERKNNLRYLFGKTFDILGNPMKAIQNTVHKMQNFNFIQ